MFDRLAAGIAGLTGWRAALLTVGAGAVSALAFAPVHFLPALLTFSILAWRIEGAGNWRAAALTGWLFAFGYHVAGLYWISNALLVDGDRFAWVVPFAALGLPLVLAFFPACTLALAPRLAAPGWGRVVAVIALWCGAEYLRSVLFTGFPWNLAAYALSGADTLVQAASILGAHGLSLLTLLAATAPAIACGVIPRPAPVRGAGWAMVLVIPLALWSYGEVRLSNATAGLNRDVAVRIVQGNIPQREKWDGRRRDVHLARYMRLSQSRAPAARGPALAPDVVPRIIIWPETAVATFLDRDPGLARALSRAIPSGSGGAGSGGAGDGMLVAGSLSMDSAATAQASGGRERFYNSIFFLTPGGVITARYDKAHLVPFGEYLPFSDWLPLPAMVPDFTGFSAGPGPRTIAVPPLGLVSPLICYEVIFPGSVIAPAPSNATSDSGRPAVLLNLTNDAWYGESAGPYQHLAIARMRAIEEGIPLIRAANTGISGLYDAYGRRQVDLGLGRTGAIDAYLPRALPAPIFARAGWMIYPILIALMLGIAALSRRPGWVCRGRGAGD